MGLSEQGSTTNDYHASTCETTQLYDAKELRKQVRGTCEFQEFMIAVNELAVKQPVRVLLSAENPHPRRKFVAVNLQLKGMEKMELEIVLKVRSTVVDWKDVPKRKKMYLVQKDLQEECGFRKLFEITIDIPVKPFIRHLQMLPPLHVALIGPVRTCKSSIANLFATTRNLTGAGRSFVIRPAQEMGGSGAVSHTQMITEHEMPSAVGASNMKLTDMWGWEDERDVWPLEFFRNFAMGLVPAKTKLEDVLNGNAMELAEAEAHRRVNEKDEDADPGPELVVITINVRAALDPKQRSKMIKYSEIVNDPALGKQLMFVLTQFDDDEQLFELANPELEKIQQAIEETSDEKEKEKLRKQIVQYPFTGADMRKDPSLSSPAVRQVCRDVSRHCGIPLNAIYPLLNYREEEKTPELELASMVVMWHMYFKCGKADYFEE